MLPLCYAAPFNESSCNNVNQGSSQFPNYISFVKWYRTLSENYSKPFFVSVKWLEIITSVARLLFRSKIQKGVGDLHSSEVAFLLSPSGPGIDFRLSQKFVSMLMRFINSAVRGQRLENVDQTHKNRFKMYPSRCKWKG